MNRDVFYIESIINLIHQIYLKGAIKIFDCVVLGAKKKIFPFSVEIKLLNVYYDQKLLKRIQDMKYKELKNWIYYENSEDNYIIIKNN